MEDIENVSNAVQFRTNHLNSAQSSANMATATALLTFQPQISQYSKIPCPTKPKGRPRSPIRTSFDASQSMGPRSTSTLLNAQAPNRKRGLSDVTVNQRGPKRKTLAEKAGEPIRHDAAAPASSRPVNHAVKSLVKNGRARAAPEPNSPSNAVLSEMLQYHRAVAMGAQTELEAERAQIADIRLQHSAALEGLEASLTKQRTMELNLLQERLQSSEALHQERNAHLQGQILQLCRKVEYLESGHKAQAAEYAAMQKQVEEATAAASSADTKMRSLEAEKRKLFNQVQELKGNIRVFCRIRPANSVDGTSTKQAQISYPDTEDSTAMEIRGLDESNSLGKDVTKTHPFSFDRVFPPATTNNEIFEEVSHFVQSTIDGYNTCIFAYGQTGSGKTHTMSSDDGMIPQALRMIYERTSSLKQHGWQYSMIGSFVEVYNETLHDLLSNTASSSPPRQKLEIKHDLALGRTSITNAMTVTLDSSEQVESVLSRAMAKRSVAATYSNERSSRSHAVFMLTLSGTNALTSATCRGTLNLVDLAGSERLNASKAEGARLKETQSINKSLSCLGDVIAALGQGGDGSAMAHIPYRNSKLTNLLQFSLGGNAKTLMFVMASPLKAHLAETLTSLRFATKVHNTHVGVARKA